MIQKLQKNEQPEFEKWVKNFAPTPTFNWTPEALLETQSSCEIWGIFKQSELISALALQVQPGLWDIQWLATKPGFEGQGWMKKLLQNRLNDAASRNCAVILEVHENNEKAQELYAQLGFTQVGMRKNYYQDRGDALVMTFSKSQNPV